MKNPPYRPTKYKKEYAKQLENFLAEGYPIQAFAGEIGVNLDTLYEWTKVHKDFSEAKKVGRSKGLKTLLKIGRAAAAGQLKNASASHWIFMMKNIYGWRDRVEFFEDEQVDEIEFTE